MVKRILKIRYKMEGGVAYFPGLAREIVVDTDALQPNEASRLQRLIEKAASAPPAPTLPDGRRYRVHIEIESGSHDLVVSESSTEPAARELAQWLAGHLKAKQGGTGKG